MGRVETVRGPQKQPYAPDPNRRNVHAAAYSDLFGGLWNEFPGVYIYECVHRCAHIFRSFFLYAHLFGGLWNEFCGGVYTYTSGALIEPE